MLKKLFLVAIFFKSAFVISQVPVWHWAKDANSSSPETLWDVSTDPTSTNVYVGGSFKGNLSTKYGAAFSTSSGNSDAFFAKYDVLGNVIWAFKIAGTSGDEEVRSIAVDPSGNLYVTGSFNSTVDFDPSAATFNLSTAGGTDGFLAKYSPAGSFLWAVKFGGSNNENSYNMAADANGIYITGNYESLPATFYSYSSPVTKTTFFSDSQMNMFGAKYNANGVVQWVISGGSNLDDYGVKVIADATHIYFLGIYYHDISFKSATGVSGATMPDQQHNEQNTFILQVTQAGNLGWQTNITTSQGGKDVTGWCIAQDAGNLYVTGQSDGNINFKYPTPTLTQVISNNNDLFLTKLSKTSGTFLWNTSATGNGAGDQAGHALEINSLGNIILGGSFNTGLNYTSIGGPNLTASGQDVFITGYNNAGAFLWTYKAGGSGTENINGLATDNFGNIYLAGDHSGAATFGTVTLGTGGGTDIYLAKLGCALVSNNTISSAQTICSGNAPSALAGSVPVNATLYNWEMSTDNLNWINASGTHTNQNYSPPPLTATTYYRRMASGAGCLGSPSNTLTITVIQLPSVSNAGSNQTVCSSSATLNATAATSGTGSWSVITGTANVTSVNNPASAITGLSFGSNSFVWTISNSPCPSSSSTITIVRQIPPTSSAGNQQTVCSTTATLAAVNPTLGSGAWSVIAGSANVSSIANPSSQVTALSTGANTFVWTVSNGVCPVATSTVTILRDDVPTMANAGSDQTVCSTSCTLNANSPLVGAASWSVISGTSTVTAISNPSSIANNLSVGQNKFIWTISNGVCPSSTSTVIITRDDFPTVAVAGNVQSVCSASCNLSANIPIVGVGSWFVSVGTASIAVPSNPASLANNLSMGQNKFVWTIVNGICPPSSSTVTVNRDIPPSLSNAGVSQTICSTSFTLNANVPLTGTGTWSVTTGSGNIVSAMDPSSAVNLLSSGNNIFTWVVTNGVCPASTSTVSVMRDEDPTASNAGADQNICSTSATLSANLPLVGVGQWFLISGNAIILDIDNSSTAVSVLSIGQNKFEWKITNGVCAPSSSTVTIIRDQNPSLANAGQDKTICGNTITLNANTPAIGSGNWSFISGGGNTSSSSDPNTGVTNLATGSNILLWTISNGACVANSDTVIITSDALPTLANAGDDKTNCAENIDLAANLASVGTGSWSVVSGNANIQNVSQHNTFVTNLSAGQNIFKWTIANGVCPASTDEVIVTRQLPPDNAVTGPDKQIDEPVTELSALTPSIGTGSWSVISGNARILDPDNANTTVSNLSFGDNVFRWTTHNGSCPESSDDILIYVNPLRIPNGFSPNNDGFNDAYVIPTLEFYPNVKFNVFNRWGGLVYENNNYKNEWAGTNLSGEKLSDDTYYYILQLNDKTNFTGFIILKQNK